MEIKTKDIYENVNFLNNYNRYLLLGLSIGDMKLSGLFLFLNYQAEWLT